MSIRRATLRAASATLAVASVFILATCDLATLTKPKDNTTNPFDSTELVLGGPSTVTLGGTAQVTVTSATPSISLANTVKQYTSASPNIITIDTAGLMTGVAIGTSKITATILAPELGSGVTISQVVRVRYKGIKVTTPVTLDSIAGLGQTRTVAVQGTNNSNVNVGAVVSDSLRMRTGAGVIDTSSLRVVGTTITAKKGGSAYLVAFVDGLKDSVLVRVRQVAKSITFPTTDYIAKAVNYNLTVPLTVKDVADSIIPTPTITWATKDTTKATITAAGLLKMKSTASDSVFATMDTVTRKQRILVQQVVASMTKFQGDARSDTVAKNVSVVPTVTALDSGSTIVQGASVQFKTGIGLNASVIDTLPILTSALGRAAPASWKIGDVAGTNNNTLIATSGTATTTFTVSGIAGQPRKLGFGVNTSSTAVGVAMNPTITVQVQDSLGNLVANATNSITIAIANNVNTATLSATSLTVAAVNGVATFANVSLNATGSGYTLQASSGALTSTISNGFDIFGGASKLAFTTQPAGTTAGATLPTIRVAVQDAGGNTVASSTASVTLAFANNAGAGTLAGTLTVAAVAGVATFPNVSINNAASGYTLQATSGVLTLATSNAFTISPVGPAAKLAYSVQPTNVVAGAAIAPSIKVQILDASGALTSSTAQVVLTIESTSPSGSAINGTTTRAAVAGVATFDDISLSKAGNSYKLLASSGSLTTATSTSFNVAVGVANKLAFVQQPTHTVTTGTIAPAVTVEVEDVSGNRITTGTAVSVALAMTTGVCTSVGLAGNSSQNTVAGVATFSALVPTTTATFCTLTATATGLSASTSTTFNVTTASAPAKLKFTTQPSNAIAGQTVSSTVVTLQDASGATASATTSTFVSIGLTGGPSTTVSGTSGVSVTTGTSTGTFSSFNVTTAGTYRLVATATGFDPDTSAQFTISAAAASKLTFVVQPANVVAGVPQPASIQVAVQDANSNTVTTDTRVISLTGSINNFGATMAFSSGAGITSLFTATAVAGVATFSNVAVRKASTTDRLSASGGGLNGTSSTFDVSAAPLSTLGFTGQPVNSQSANTIGTITVQAQDSVGNAYTDFGNSMTLTLTGGTIGAVLSGVRTQAPVAGVATFSGLTIDKAGTGYQLSASATGVSNGLSATFTISAGAATKLAWLVQPAATTFFNAPLGAAGATTVLAIQDAVGNTATTDNRGITFTAAGPSTTFKVNGGSTTSGIISASSGLISFTSGNQISMTTAGAGYQVTAAAAGLASATTTAFAVNATDAAHHLGFQVSPSAVNSGALMAPSVVVGVLDQWGNIITTASNSTSLAIGTDPGPGTTLSGGAAIPASSGLATFSGLSLNKGGNGYTLVASAAGLASGTSATFNVDPCTTGSTLTTHTLGTTSNGTYATADCSGATTPKDRFSITTSGTTYFGAVLTTAAGTPQLNNIMWGASGGILQSGGASPLGRSYLLAAGTYELQAQASAVGSYSLATTVNATAPACQVIILTRNVTSSAQTLDNTCTTVHDASTADPGTTASKRDYYIWQPAGTAITVRMLAGSILDPFLEVFDASNGNAFVDSNDDNATVGGVNSMVTIAAPGSGRFLLVRASHYVGGGSPLSGTFTLTVDP